MLQEHVLGNPKLVWKSRRDFWGSNHWQSIWGMSRSEITWKWSGGREFIRWGPAFASPQGSWRHCALETCVLEGSEWGTDRHWMSWVGEGSRGQCWVVRSYQASLLWAKSLKGFKQEGATWSDKPSPNVIVTAMWCPVDKIPGNPPDPKQQGMLDNIRADINSQESRKYSWHCG